MKILVALFTVLAVATALPLENSHGPAPVTLVNKTITDVPPPKNDTKTVVARAADIAPGTPKLGDPAPAKDNVTSSNATSGPTELKFTRAVELPKPADNKTSNGTATAIKTVRAVPVPVIEPPKKENATVNASTPEVKIRRAVLAPAPVVLAKDNKTSNGTAPAIKTVRAVPVPVIEPPKKENATVNASTSDVKIRRAVLAPAPVVLAKDNKTAENVTVKAMRAVEQPLHPVGEGSKDNKTLNGTAPVRVARAVAVVETTLKDSNATKTNSTGDAVNATTTEQKIAEFADKLARDVEMVLRALPEDSLVLGSALSSSNSSSNGTSQDEREARTLFWGGWGWPYWGYGGAWGWPWWGGYPYRGAYYG